MPLFIAPTDVPLIVLAVKGDPKVVKRLQSLGVAKGETITLMKYERGAAVILVKEARYALDHQTSGMIEVNPLA